MGKEKRGKLAIIIISAIVILVLFFGYFYFNYAKANNLNSNGEKNEGQKFVNPVIGLSKEEAIAQFNESFILYLLVSIRAYDLHSPLLNSDTPKIEIIVDGDDYNAEVIGGGIRIGRGAISGEDIVIRTTREEGVKMLKDKAYLSKSFNDGKSSVELVAGKIELAAKGYLSIYEELS